MLTIDRMHTRYSFPAGARDASLVRSRLDRLARERLPGETSLRFQTGDDDGEVYRIRHVALELRIDLGRATDGEIVRRWGESLARTVGRRIAAGADADVVRYPSHAAYLAAFFRDLLAGRAWSRWMYEEFRPLEDLPAGTIAAHILGARPGLIVPVATLLEQDGHLDALLHRLSVRDMHVIWELGLAYRDLPPVQAPPVGLTTLLAEIITGMALESGGDSANARNKLRIYLAATSRQPALAGSPVLGSACRHLALLYSLLPSLEAVGAWQLLSDSGFLPHAALAAMQTSAPESTWLRAATATAEGRAYVAELARALRPKGPASGNPAPHEPVSVQRLATSYAGLALLLPVIRDIETLATLGNVAIYQLLLEVATHVNGPLALGDHGIGLLAGVQAQELPRARDHVVSWPNLSALPSRASSLQDEVATDGRAHEHQRAGIALHLLQRFAAGLRGFERSSAEYLIDQFIHRPGTLRVTPQEIDITISSMPLGIVLRMAGRDGDQGSIPWLANRRLHIRLPDG